MKKTIEKTIENIEENIEENIDVIDILDKISNDILIDFSHSSNYNQVTEKEQIISRITKNIDVIKNLYANNIIYVQEKINAIFNKLKHLRHNKNKNEYLTYYKKIRKTLGHIIYDIFQYSDYHVLISNVPENAIPIINNDINDIDILEPVNSETIYNTVEYYIGSDTVDNIFQVSPLAYLVKMKKESNSKILCNKLNKMQIGSNIIKVELLNPDSKINLDVTEPIASVTEPVVSVTEPVITVSSIIESKPNILIMPIINDLNDTDDEIEIVYSKDDNDNNNKINENTNISDNKETSFIGHIYNKISNIFSFFRRS